MSDLRILAGVAKGRSLQIPSSARPTPARVRKSLFDILEHRFEPGTGLLDLYAGAGGVGLEAASRGFQATLIEENAKAIVALERNRRSLGLEAALVRADAQAWLRQPKRAFEIVFIDPPYQQDILELARKALLAPGLLTETGVLIVQHPVQLKIVLEQPGFARECRVYGSNVLTFWWAVQPE